MAPCTTSCASSLAARMPSLRCMTRSARLRGTEQGTWGARCMGMDLLSLAPASLLSQISERNPSRNPRGGQPSGLQGSSVKWKHMGFGVRQTCVPVPDQPLLSRVTDFGLVTWPLCAPCLSVKGGKDTYVLDIIHTKGPLCGRGFLSDSQHLCFHATSHLARPLDSTAEARQSPHRSPVHGFG